MDDRADSPGGRAEAWSDSAVSLMYESSGVVPGCACNKASIACLSALSRSKLDFALYRSTSCALIHLASLRHGVLAASLQVRMRKGIMPIVGPARADVFRCSSSVARRPRATGMVSVSCNPELRSFALENDLADRRLERIRRLSSSAQVRSCFTEMPSTSPLP